MSRDSLDRVVLAGFLLAVKLALLAAMGPATLPDTGGYVAFADMILSGAVQDETLASSSIPGTIFRVAGYPLAIAGAKIVGGAAWPWLLMLVQIAVSIGATLLVHATARRLGLGRWASLGAALAQATSLALVLDQSILTDSLYGALAVVASCLLIRAALAGHTRAPLGTAVLAGVMVALAFTLREATLYLVVGFVPLAALGARDGDGRWRRLRAAVLVALFVLPLALLQQGYREWNRARLGVPLITTGGQTNMIYAVSKAARRDPSVFDADTPVAKVARTTFRTYEFVEVLEVNHRLFREYGMSAADINKVGMAAYFDAWRRHPGAMIRVPLGHLRENQALLSIRPMESLRELILWCRGDDNGFARWRAVKEGRWGMAPVVAVDGLSKLASILVFAAFALLTPWRLWRGDGVNARTLALAGAWLLYFCFVLTYALVHLETRYVAPVVPLGILGGFANLAWLASAWKAGRRARTNGL